MADNEIRKDGAAGKRERVRDAVCRALCWAYDLGRCSASGCVGKCERPDAARDTFGDMADAAIAAYEAASREPGPGEVRVRACVGVMPLERYIVACWKDSPDDEMREAVECDADDEVQIRWIEANVRGYEPPVEDVAEGEEV